MVMVVGHGPAMGSAGPTPAGYSRRRREYQVTGPKILGLDIETLAAKYWVWNPYKKENLPISMMIEPSRMIMWGAKWFGKSKVYQADERDGTEEMFSRLHGLMSEADMVVSYNGDRFDIPWIEGGVAQYGLPPLPPITSLDLFKTVRRLRYQSSKLAYVAPLLGIGEKIKNAGWELWDGVAKGDQKSWQEMRRYNAGDVRLLEAGYVRLRPYIRNHPRLYPKTKGIISCGVCGGTHLQFGRGTYSTQAGMQERFLCLNPECGKWGRTPMRRPAP